MRKVSCVLLILLLGLLLTAEEKKFGYEFTKGRKGEIFKVALYTDGKRYDVLPAAIKIDQYLLYFAGENMTTRQDLLMDKFKEVKVVRDEENKKDIKVLITLHDGKGKTVNDYILELVLEIWKGEPFLAIYSRLRYLGDKKAKTALNWGIGDHFKYYTIPKGSQVKTYKLGVGRGRRKYTIGKTNWLYAHSGKGYGLGIITSGIAGKGEDFIFVNSWPRAKYLTAGKSLDVFMIISPVKGGYKPIQQMFEKLKRVKWDLDKL